MIINGLMDSVMFKCFEIFEENCTGNFIQVHIGAYLDAVEVGYYKKFCCVVFNSFLIKLPLI